MVVRRTNRSDNRQEAAKRNTLNKNIKGRVDVQHLDVCDGLDFRFPGCAFPRSLAVGDIDC